MNSRRRPSGDGASELFRFLKNYDRVSLDEACRVGLREEDGIGIWAKDGGQWRRYTEAERTMK